MIGNKIPAFIIDQRAVNANQWVAAELAFGINDSCRLCLAGTGFSGQHDRKCCLVNIIDRCL